jgi:ABC-type nitrate/sulfonate/bicarbonate transport system ATPase subunit
MENDTNNAELDRPVAQGDVALSVQILDKSFGSKRILSNLKFDVRLGETVAITGPSGCGKSTLLRIISGLDREFNGQISAPDAIGFVFQEPVLLPWLSARQNLQVASGISVDAAQSALQTVGLADCSDLFPKQMSLGQQRRVALARAFAVAPKLLLLDEAFVSLDPKLADDMMTVFENLRSIAPIATVIVTHYVSEATRLADRIISIGD